MKRSRKLKLLISFSSITTLTTFVPVVATSCTISPNNINIYGPDRNAKTININEIKWKKQTTYKYSTEADIITAIKNDNKDILNYYLGW